MCIRDSAVPFGALGICHARQRAAVGFAQQLGVFAVIALAEDMFKGLARAHQIAAEVTVKGKIADVLARAVRLRQARRDVAEHVFVRHAPDAGLGLGIALPQRQLCLLYTSRCV